MRAYHLRAFGLESHDDPTNLALVDLPDPEPGPLQVRVRLRAASLNFRDVLVARGSYYPKQRLPMIPVSDGVGVVDAVGPGVTRVAVGDRVCPVFMQRWIAGKLTKAVMQSTLGSPHDGVLAELAVFSEEGLVKVPSYLTDEEAATLPCAALTAWSALVAQGGLKAGDTILTQGTGGVSVFAIQIAAMHGARAIVTSSRHDKLARALGAGAWKGISYVDEPAWSVSARKLTGGVGVDHVVELGGAGTLEQSLRAVRPGGTVSLIGVLSGGEAKVSLFPIVMQNVRVQGVLVGHRDMFEDMLAAFEHHGTRPVVDRVYAFEDARQAFEHVTDGAHFGKVVIRIGAADRG